MTHHTSSQSALQGLDLRVHPQQFQLRGDYSSSNGPQRHCRAKQAVKTIYHKRTCQKEGLEQSGVKSVCIYMIPYLLAWDEGTELRVSLQVRFTLCETGCTFRSGKDGQRGRLCSGRDTLPYPQTGRAQILPPLLKLWPSIWHGALAPPSALQ